MSADFLGLFYEQRDKSAGRLEKDHAAELSPRSVVYLRLEFARLRVLSSSPGYYFISYLSDCRVPKSKNEEPQRIMPD